MPTQQKTTHKRFDAELEIIRARIMEMGGLVELQFQQALHSLCEANTHLARQVIDQDHRVNQFEVQIDGLCCSAIACHQPTAGDLRAIVTATRLIMQLERIGDEAKKIAHMTERRALQYRLVMPKFSAIRHVAESAREMLQDVLDSFARRDVASARKKQENIRRLQEEFATILRNVIGYMSENPRSISTSLDILFMAKAIERIVEHIMQISELVIESSDRHAEALPA